MDWKTEGYRQNKTRSLKSISLLWELTCWMSLSYLLGNMCLEAILICCTTNQWPTPEASSRACMFSATQVHAAAYRAPRQSYLGFLQIARAGKWEPVLLKPAFANLSFSAFPICQSGTVILTSFIRYFDIHWRPFFLLSGILAMQKDLWFFCWADSKENAVREQKNDLCLPKCNLSRRQTWTERDFGVSVG